jgi:hypothetical protein
MKRTPFVQLDDAALDTIVGGVGLLSIFTQGVDGALQSLGQASTSGPGMGFPKIDFAKRMAAEMRRDDEMHGPLGPAPDLTPQDRIDGAFESFQPVHETTPQDRIDDAFDLTGTDGDTRPHVDEMPDRGVSHMMDSEMQHDAQDFGPPPGSPQEHIDHDFSAVGDTGGDHSGDTGGNTDGNDS